MIRRGHRRVPRVGLAHPVPVLGRHGHRRPLGADEPGRELGLREDGQDRTGPASCRSQPLFKLHWRELILGTFYHACDLCALLPDDHILAELWPGGDWTAPLARAWL